MTKSPDLAVLPDFAEARRRGFRPSLGFGGFEGSFEAWREAGLRAFRAALPPYEGPAQASVVEAQTHPDGTTEHHLRFRFATGARSEGTLLLPPGEGPFPALLLLHDHGSLFEAGWRKLFGGEGADNAVARFYGGRPLARHCAAEGLAVLAVDALGWGSRPMGGYEGQQALAANLMQLGWSWAGVIAAEDVQAARWLADHPRVDAGRVGALGFSFGAFRAWQVAALSDAIQASAGLSWMARRAELMVPGNNILRGQSAFAMLHPTLTGGLDFPDLAGLGAPKPLFLRSGRRDHHFPPAAVEGAFADLRGIYDAAGAGRLDAGFFDGGHECGLALQDEAVAFFRDVFAQNR